jgi:SSS family solute:Na+ symporter
MAQNFWGAIWAWTACFVVTIGVSLLTAPKPDADLQGLVVGSTPPVSDRALAWYLRPAVLGVFVLLCTAVLNVIFW